MIKMVEADRRVREPIEAVAPNGDAQVCLQHSQIYKQAKFNRVIMEGSVELPELLPQQHHPCVWDKKQMVFRM